MWKQNCFKEMEKMNKKVEENNNSPKDNQENQKKSNQTDNGNRSRL